MTAVPPRPDPRLLLALALLFTMSCGDEYAVEINYIVPPMFSVEALAALDEAPVLQYATTVYTLDAGADVPRTCEGYRFGRDDTVRLSGAGRPLTDDDAAIDRVGDKLVFVEGIDPVRGIVLRGCGALGTLSPGLTVLDIPLTPLSTPRFSESNYLVDAPLEGSVPLGPPATMLATDRYNRPVGTPIEIRITDPGGTRSESVLFETTTAEPTNVPVEVGFTGPFRIDAISAEPLTNLAARSTGFAQPSRRSLTPIDFDTRVPRQLLPVRYGPADLAYVASSFEVGEDVRERQLHVAMADGSVDPGGAPQFTAAGAADALAGRNLRFLGPARDAQGRGELLLAQTATDMEMETGPLGILRAPGVMPPTFFFAPDLVVRHVGGDEPLGLLTPMLSLALGDCTVDVDAGPYLIALLSLSDPDAVDDDEGRRDRTSHHILQGETLTPIDFGERLPLLTFCVDTDAGPHRVMVVSDGNGEVLLTDIDDGPAGMSDPPAPELLQYTPLPSTVGLGATALGTPAVLLRAMNVDLTVRVVDVWIGASADSASAFDGLARYDLPALPRASLGGPLLMPGQRADAHLLGVGGLDENVPAATFLYVVGGDIVGAPIEQNAPIAGRMPLTHCGRADRCAMLQADVDDDGINELYFGRTSGAGSDEVDFVALRAPPAP